MSNDRVNPPEPFFDEPTERRRAEYLAEAQARFGPKDPKDPKTNINLIDSAFAKLGAGISSTLTQLNYGQQNLATLNYTIQGSSLFLGQVTTLLATRLPGLALGLKAAGDGIASYVQSVNLAADAQFAAYQVLAKYGAADQFTGLTQVNEFANKMGYVARGDLTKFASFVAESSEALSMLGGTVEGGLKQFANLSAAIQRTTISTEMARMGYADADQQNKALMNLIKTISAAGGSISTLGKTSEQQAKSVQEYIKQQDIVTRLTGLTAEAQSKAFEQAQTNDRFAVASYAAQQELDEARSAPDAETDQGKARIADAEGQFNKLNYLASLSQKIGGDIGKAILDAEQGAPTKELTQAMLLFGPQLLTLAQAKNTNTEEYAKNLATFLKSGAERRAGTGPGSIRKLAGISPEVTAYGPFKAIKDIARMKIAPDGTISLETGAPGPGGKPPETEANLANVVAVKQNLAALTIEMNKFINEGIGPVTNAMVSFTQDLRTKAIAAMKMLGVADYMTKEQRDRYESETGANAPGVGKGRSEALENAKETVRQDVKAGIETVEAVTTKIVDPIVNTFKEAGKSAAEALDDVTKTIKKSLDGFTDMLKNWNRTVPPPPVSGVSFNSSTMARLLNDYRNAAGPDNRFEPSLVDTVYRPGAADRDNQGTGSDILRDDPTIGYRAQMVAYETMIKQQGELIDLLQRSVGIQDRTLRATYNA